MDVIESSIDKIKQQVLIPSESVDSNQCDIISALDRAIAETDEPEVFNTFEEYKVAVQGWKKEWDLDIFN